MSLPLETLLGRLAVARGLVSEDQLAAALAAQAHEKPAPPLGVVLVERGWLSRAQVEELLLAQAAAFARQDPRGAVPGGAWHFGHLAVVHGFASADQVHRALREQGRRAECGEPHFPLGRILIEQGAMTDSAVEELLRLQGQAAPTKVPGAPPDAPGAAAAPAPDDPTVIGPPPAAGPTSAISRVAPPRPVARRFGTYELVQELGRGGMGVVYKAWRTDLRAYFAVKILLAREDPDGEGLVRFQREAQASAGLRHAGIVSVHDLGVEEGKVYLAMEYVEGVSLDKALRDPTKAGLAPPEGAGAGDRRARGLAMPDAARIACEVAEAIEYAHSHGVVHRDLKPANVLLDRAGRARVVDFGLAKILRAGGATGATTLTRTGVVLGTLAHMPPEQASGDVHHVGVRSDVYSLGALLYELVTGRLPFESLSELELLGDVLLHEPRSPRRVNPRVPRDLEVIVQKAMEKEPEHRYARAGDFAADLRRFLAGGPISARPASAYYRAERWVRRRRPLAAALAALVVVAGAAAVLAARAHRAAEEGAALRAQLLRDLRGRARSLVDATLTLRRSGLPLKKAATEYLPQLQRAVEAVERADPRGAEPHYHLGRMYRALLLMGPALAEQERALACDPAYVPSLYERALLGAREYGNRLEGLRAAWRRKEGLRRAGGGAVEAGDRRGTAPVPLPSEDALIAADPAARALRARILGDLDRLEALAGARPGRNADPEADPAVGGPAPAALDLARALRLVIASTGAADLERARALLAGAVRSEPTREEAYQVLARLTEAAGDYGAAIHVYGRGLDADAGFLPFWMGRGEARRTCALALSDRGGDPTGDLAAAEGDFGRALELDAEFAPAWMQRGLARMDLGTWKRRRGEDPASAYDHAQADLTTALRLDPASGEAWLWRGGLRANLANWRRGLGQEPGDLYAGADADLTEAVARSADSAEAWTVRGVLRSNWGVYRRGRSEDPGGLYARAEADLGRALVLDSGSAAAWASRGNLRANAAAWRLQQGDDPTDLYARADADYGEALRLDPDSAECWMWRGTLRTAWGIDRGARGGEPGPLHARALEDFDRSIARNPGSAEARWRRGYLHYCDERWAEAVADFEAAARINPASASSFREALDAARRNLGQK